MKPFVLVFVMAAFDIQVGTDTQLTTKEKATIRKNIYGKISPTAIPMEGKYAAVEILVIPVEVEQMFGKKPTATLDLLQEIGAGANPEDSVHSLAVAMSLVLDNYHVGAVVVRNFEKKAYDEVDKDWKVTPREHWLGWLKSDRKRKKK